MKVGNERLQVYACRTDCVLKHVASTTFVHLEMRNQLEEDQKAWTMMVPDLLELQQDSASNAQKHGF